MYRVIDEVLAADLEVGDSFRDADSLDVVTVVEKEDQGSQISLTVTDPFDDKIGLFLYPFRPIELLMEVDHDE